MKINRDDSSGWIQLSLAFYLLACGMMCVYFLVDVWSQQFFVIRILFPGINFKTVDLATIKTISYTIVGSVIGAVIISLKGLHVHGVVHQEFKNSYSGSYVIGPWAAGLLAIAVYGLMRGGLLIFGGASEIENPTQATEFSYLGLGFLIGFAWDKVLVKLNTLAVQIFGDESNKPVAAASSGEKTEINPEANP